MKKIFILFFLFISLFISLFYLLLFTNYGNSLIASYLENRVNSEQNSVKLKVEKLKITFDTVDLNATIDDNSYININGNLKIFTKSVDLKYDIKINELQNLKNLLNYDFKGAFFTNGTFIGDSKRSEIKGISNFASGETNYTISLVDFEIDNLVLNSKNLKLDELFGLINKPIYSKGNLNLDLNINNFKSNNIGGHLIASLEKGLLNNEYINKNFNQTFSSVINFDAKINSIIVESKAISDIDLKSSLLDLVFDKSEFNLNNNEFYGKFNLFVKNLQKVAPIFGIKTKGELNSYGIVKSDNQNINIDGYSDIAESKTTYKLNLKNYNLKSLEYKIDNAKVENFLKLTNNPVYATGDFSTFGKIDNFKELTGNSFIDLKNVKLINEVINAVYSTNIHEQIILDSKIDTKFENNSAISKIVLKSNIANLDLKDLLFDFKTSNVVGKYSLVSEDLTKLKDFTKITLRGNAKIDGDIEVKNNKWLLNGYSKLAKGDFDFNLNDDDLKANLKDADMKSFLFLINQKENFDSKVNLNLDYNLLTKKGDLVGEFLNGHFLENDFTKIVNQFAKVDLTKEVFENSKLNTKIDDKLLTSNLFMQSQRSKIEVQNSKIDLEKNLISAKIDTQIKDNKFSVSLENDLHNPTLSFDLKDVLQKNIDKLGEKLNKFLGK